MIKLTNQHIFVYKILKPKRIFHKPLQNRPLFIHIFLVFYIVSLTQYGKKNMAIGAKKFQKLSLVSLSLKWSLSFTYIYVIHF